ncbi:LysR family transcriptional regulator [Metapseudomonas resinovorans]|uniref:Putative LysR family transcriptional regulator n=1 Tax=Metapseudomonas resinovorans NBRC 106553 TaxID=1245471 RepID=S6BEY4_METRE|nr:LysR family transcriptional regulator [Pseudomonas resinovorans]BAN47604.1 putative LysR family transcriptional regulator [Pseudomonas resinovorans NBRC 106553]
MDKLSALSMFVATAEHGSFSRAAEQLGKTPSALTKAVGHLESELGVRLFERTTRRMALTEAGHIYLEGARQALMQLQLAGEEVDQLQHELRGSLRLTAPPSFGPAFLHEVCCRYMEAHPQVRLEVDLNDAFVDLIDGGYDLALRDGPTDLPGLIARPLTENRIYLCASPAYLERKGLPVILDTIPQHDWLIFQHPLLNRHFWWLRQGDERIRLAQPAARMVSDNYDFLLACTLRGHGLQVLPRWSAEPYLASGQLVRVMSEYLLEPDVFGPWVHVLYLAHRRRTRKVRAFIEMLEGYMQERGIG